MLTLKILLWYKIKLLFASWKAFFKTMLLALLLMVVGFYGLILGMLIDNPEELGGVSSDNLMKFVYTGVFGFILMKDFFPTYKNVVHLFSRVYPVSNFKRWFIQFAYEIFIPHTLYVSVFLLPALIMSDFVTIFHYLQVILYFLLAIFTSRNIRFLFERRPKNAGFFTGFLLVALTISLATNLTVTDPSLLLGLNLLFLVVLLGYNYKLENTDAILRKIDFEFNFFGLTKLNNHPLLILAFKEKVIRNALLTALLMKAGFLSALYVFPDFFGGMTYIFTWLYISPMIIMNSGASNLWGFFRPVWLTVELHNGRIFELIKIHLKLTAFIFFIDFLITFLILGFAGDITIHKTIYYFSALIVAIVISIWFSLGNAKSMEGATTIKRNKSSFSLLFLSLFFTTLLILPAFHPLFYAGYFIIFLMLLYLVYELPHYYSEKRYVLYEQLFKSKDV